MTCEHNAQLQAYHDGELTAEARASFERHLTSCDSCERELAQLRALSAAFNAAPRPSLSQISRHRLHLQIDAAMERGLVRFAWSLSGVAASILLAGSLWLAQAKPPQPQAAPPWVVAAASAHPMGDNAASPAAQWYLADASSRSDDLP